jgi:hypothetical protein
MKSDKKKDKPRWPVVWQCDVNQAGRMGRPGKIDQLPRAVREELNRRLQKGERGKSLARWLNELPGTKTALARCLDGPKVTLQNLAEWKKGGFRDWQSRRDTESQIARQFQEWVLQSQTQEKLFGPPMTEFIMRNRIRMQFGRGQIAREDIPPGENWDIPLITQAEHTACFYKIIGTTPPATRKNPRKPTNPTNPKKPPQNHNQTNLWTQKAVSLANLCSSETL